MSCCGSSCGGNSRDPVALATAPADGAAAAPRQTQPYTTSSTITPANRWDHFLARWAFRRENHRVEPGLYTLGQPTTDSPVFVSANYTLSFDALRSSLSGLDGYILVLDTDGVNVWCAAGKGTFGTEELVHRIAATELDKVVAHRRLILPQLGAPGVAAHEVKQRTGFQVEYGPIRAEDIPDYLKTGRATPEMRQARFTLRDRLVLIPVELALGAVPTAIAAAIAVLLGGMTAAISVVAAFLAGIVLFPLLLPWIPTKDFTTKGLILGLLTSLPFTLFTLLRHANMSTRLRAARGAAYLLAPPAITAFLSLNFTGSSTYTSKSGVKREMYSYIPTLAGMFLVGLALLIGARITHPRGES